MTSKINFAVPSRNNLYSSSSEIKEIFLPGINEESLKVIAKHVGNKPMKAVDERKISRGRGQNMGDIDCWGFESGPSLLDRKEKHNEEMNFLNTFQERVAFLEEKELSNIVSIHQQEK